MFSLKTWQEDPIFFSAILNIRSQSSKNLLVEENNRPHWPVVGIFSYHIGAEET